MGEGGVGGQRGDAYSRTASGRGPIFKKRHFTLEDAVLGEGVCVCVCGFEVAHAGKWGRGGGAPVSKKQRWRQLAGAAKDMASDSRGGGPEPGSTCARSSAVKQHALECVCMYVCVCLCVETKLHLRQGSRHNSFLFYFFVTFYTLDASQMWFFSHIPTVKGKSRG